MEKTVISINGVETTISKNEPLDLKLIPSKKKKINSKRAIDQ